MFYFIRVRSTFFRDCFYKKRYVYHGSHRSLQSPLLAIQFSHAWNIFLHQPVAAAVRCGYFGAVTTPTAARHPTPQPRCNRRTRKTPVFLESRHELCRRAGATQPANCPENSEVWADEVSWCGNTGSWRPPRCRNWPAVEWFMHAVRKKLWKEGRGYVLLEKWWGEVDSGLGRLN